MPVRDVAKHLGEGAGMGLCGGVEPVGEEPMVRETGRSIRQERMSPFPNAARDALADRSATTTRARRLDRQWPSLVSGLRGCCCATDVLGPAKEDATM